ncbi:hypothetical protein [Jeotgalibacillus malaysiensis]|uniref:hypothetical protein n=1 Tax=Jeotgalibacillus malaysiensis TaxID=1508404 RepID=UPI00384A755D
MPYIQYKEKTGVLHVGKGRFFYAGIPVEVTVDEEKELLKKHSALEKTEPETDTGSGQNQNEDDADKHTEASLKKLSADEQKALIEEFEGDVESTKNAEERIALILKLQDKE